MSNFDPTDSQTSRHDTLMLIGFWVLLGIISFVICEKLVTYANSGEEEDKNVQETEERITFTDSSNNNMEKKPYVIPSSPEEHESVKPSSQRHASLLEQ